MAANQSRDISNYLAETFPFKDRLAHFTPGNVLKPMYEKAVQAACIFEAGHRVLETLNRHPPHCRLLFVHQFLHCRAEDGFACDILEFVRTRRKFRIFKTFWPGFNGCRKQFLEICDI